MEPSPQPTPLPPLPVEAVHDLSMMGLILAADPIVQGVMVLLALSSVVCWAIILDKLFRVGGLRRQARMLESMAQAPTRARRPGEASGLAGAVCAVAQEAWADWTEGEESRAEYRDRLERAMRARVAEELRRVEPGLPFLATMGSAAPFVGLFGTVWGIMSSFTAITQSNDTSLAVVAPGIAEALFATAIGLVAAIPAVVAYNKLTTALGRAAQRLNAAAATIGGRLARHPPQQAYGRAVA
jgi:biopolymer transport protein TolQ